jgi:hypothetical protein
MPDLLEDADMSVGLASEDIARKLSRRTLLFRTLKGTAATAAALSVGSFVGVKNAFADACDCTPPGQFCWAIGKTCPFNGCPTGCSICTTSDGCGGCIYSSGYWVACTGQGSCSNGYRLCYDCKCPGCGTTCGCLSGCICCNCCSPQEVRLEAGRLAAMH